MFKVKVLLQFRDLTTKKKETRQPGDIYTIEDPERLEVLLGKNPRKAKFIEVIGIDKQCPTTKTDKKIVIFQDLLYRIGGIETFVFNLVKNFKEYDITVIAREFALPQMMALSKYAHVKKDDGSRIECDTLILGNYNCGYMLPRVRAKKVYQMIHADWRGIRQLPAWADFKWTKDNRIDDIICVSDAAAEGLKATMGYDSKVIYNILDDNYQEEEGLTFITLSRATAEKGIHRMLKMAQAFKAAGKKFTWFICCTLDQADRKVVRAIESMSEFIIVPPSIDNKMLIKGCDYLVQLSDTESFCYSAYEALQRNVPVILTNFPEAYNIVDDGENGYIVKMDLSDLDIDKIFNHRPTATYYVDRCDNEKWTKVFDGEF